MNGRRLSPALFLVPPPPRPSTAIGVGIAPDAPPPACLPSGDAAVQLMRGDVSAVPSVLATFAFRSALVAAGLALAGARGKKLMTYTLAGTGAIEAGVLAWAGYQVWKEK